MRPSSPRDSSERANSSAARIGPTVCELDQLDGPMPTLKMSRTGSISFKFPVLTLDEHDPLVTSGRTLSHGWFDAQALAFSPALQAMRAREFF